MPPLSPLLSSALSLVGAGCGCTCAQVRLRGAPDWSSLLSLEGTHCYIRSARLLLSTGAYRPSTLQYFFGFVRCLVRLRRLSSVVMLFVVSAVFLGGCAGADNSGRAISAMEGDAGVVLSLAYSRLGVPYVFGGSDWENGMDCSGFTQQVFKRVGVDIPRTAFAQFQSGQKIAREDAVPGDLIFWGTGRGNGEDHVALYVGEGRMIHESTSSGVAEVPVIEQLHGTAPQFFRVADFSEDASGGGGSANTPEGAKAYAHSLMASYGWGEGEYACLVELWEHESQWRWDATNPSSGAYGIPQALPASKMGSHGADWKSNGQTQIRWGLDYIKGRYMSPCSAWEFWQHPTSGDPSWGNWY